MFRMGKEVMNVGCNDCIFLDKTDKIEKEHCYTYGCLRTPITQIVGWIKSDNELKTMGCSNCNKLETGTKFRIESRLTDKYQTYLFCGMVNGKPLLYGMEEHKYRIVSRGCLRSQNGRIKTNVKIIPQNETQFEASKRMGKKRRKRYIEQSCDRN